MARKTEKWAARSDRLDPFLELITHLVDVSLNPGQWGGVRAHIDHYSHRASCANETLPTRISQAVCAMRHREQIESRFRQFLVVYHSCTRPQSCWCMLAELR